MKARDKRTDPRLQRQFWIWFRPAGAEAEPWQASPLRDLSPSGARFIADGGFEVGTKLEARLMLPVSTELIPVTARVAWSRSMLGKEWHLAEHGVTFDFTDEQTRQQVAEAVGYFAKGRVAQLQQERSEERRRRPRIRQPFYAKCRPVGGVGGSAWYHVNPLNLSAHGMKFLGPRLFEHGCSLECSITSQNTVRPLVLSGRAVWGKTHPSGAVEQGIEFVDVTPEQQVQLDGLVRTLSARA